MTFDRSLADAICWARRGRCAIADALARDRAHAQGKLDARYNVTLGGMPVGRGTWVIDIADDHFTASASGATAGLMRVFASGQGQSAARGAIRPASSCRRPTRRSIVTDQKYDEVRMVISGGAVKEFVAEPPTVAEPGARSADRGSPARRLRPDDRVADSGARATATLFGPAGLPAHACRSSMAACATTCSSPSSASTGSRSERGYQGVAVVCAVSFRRSRGTFRDRHAIKYLAQLRDIEAWLAPIAGYARVGPLPRGGSDPGRPRGSAGDPVRLYAATEPGDRQGRNDRIRERPGLFKGRMCRSRPALTDVPMACGAALSVLT